MFDFGKDIKRLFAQAREGEDLAWLELVGVPLLEGEARQQQVEAGRVSCRRPAEAALRAAAVWREHGRRTGQSASIVKALALAADAAREADGPDLLAAALLDAAVTTLLDHDLRGGDARLNHAATFLEGARAGRDPRLALRHAAAHAGLASRRAQATGQASALQDGAALLDAALHGLEGRSDLAADATEVRLERAGLTLEAGVRTRDARLLDQAGRDLRALVQAASPDYQPLTRARALTLCAAGLGQLARLAGNAAAREQSEQMFDAAADAFTQDHSPLDWVAIQLAMLAEGRPIDHRVLMQAEILSDGEGLVLGAMAREARTRCEVETAELNGDLTGLAAIEARLRRRLHAATATLAPLDWAADQIGLATVGAARAVLTGGRSGGSVRMALMEAVGVCTEMGAAGLARRGQTLLA